MEKEEKKVEVVGGCINGSKDRFAGLHLDDGRWEWGMRRSKSSVVVVVKNDDDESVWTTSQNRVEKTRHC